MMRNSRLNRYILSAQGHRSVFNATQSPRSYRIPVRPLAVLDVLAGMDDGPGPWVTDRKRSHGILTNGGYRDRRYGTWEDRGDEGGIRPSSPTSHSLVASTHPPPLRNDAAYNRAARGGRAAAS